MRAAIAAGTRACGVMIGERRGVFGSMLNLALISIERKPL